MTPRRLTLATLRLATAAAPLAVYFAWLAKPLVRAGHPGMAVLCLVGTVMWAAFVWSTGRPPVRRCSACDGDCPTPEACQLPIARATRPPRIAFFFAEPWFTRYPWLGPTAVGAVLMVWGCIDRYLEVAP